METVNRDAMDPFLKGAYMFLEAEEWESASEYFQKVLDNNPRNAIAHLGKLMAEVHVKNQEELFSLRKPFTENINYQNAISFADEELKSRLVGCDSLIRYNDALASMTEASSAEEYKNAEIKFSALGDYRDSIELSQRCREQGAEIIRETIYAKATAAYEIGRASTDYDEGTKNLEIAQRLFGQIIEWRDARKKESDCKSRITEWEQREQERIEKEQEIERTERKRIERERKKKEKQTQANERKRAIVWLIIVVLIIGVVVYLIKNPSVLPTTHENKTEAATNGSYSSNTQPASSTSQSADDSAYDAYQEGLYLSSLLHFSPIAVGYDRTIGIRSDYSVVATGLNDHGECDVGSWYDVVAVASGDHHTIGLKKDGTVVATGRNDQKQCSVSGWTNIVAISAGGNHSVGLRENGTVVATGDNKNGECNVGSWTDIIAIDAGDYHTVGLKKDGTVVAVGASIESDGQCNVQKWRDIVAVSAGYKHTVGLKKDGTVVSTGLNNYGQCNVSNWNHVIAISAGGYHTVAQKDNGSLIATGSNSDGQCNVSNWQGIISFAAGDSHTAGLKEDGTVVSTGTSGNGQLKTSGWRKMLVMY